MKTETLIRELLINIGEDPGRESLNKTPDRVAQMLKDLTCGYSVDVDKLIKDSICEGDYNEMVLVKDIDFYSLCEHHLIPFFGKAHVAYIPNGRFIGLSKIPRLVDAFARRLQIQERMTQQIAESLNDSLKPYGVAVIVEARHLCMQMRGVEKQNCLVTTSAMLGEFHDEVQARNEFLSLVGISRI